MIYEARLQPDPSTSDPLAYLAGAEWTPTDFDDLRDWEEASRDNCGDGFEACPAEERPTVYSSVTGFSLYRWPDEVGGWHYTAVMER